MVVNCRLIFSLVLIFSIQVEAVEQLPLEYFAKLPRFSQPRLSPDGKRLASTIISPKGKPVLVVQPIRLNKEKLDEKPRFITTAKAEYNDYDWANDDRLILNLRGSYGIRGNLWNLSRLASIDRNGSDVKHFPMSPNIHGYYRQHASVLNWLKDDDDYVLALLDDGEKSWATPEVDLVNINTGKRKRVLRNYRGVQQWLVDYQGRIRIGLRYNTRSNKTDVTTYYRKDEGSAWEVLQKIDYFDHKRLKPHRFDEDDSNILLVSSDDLGSGYADDEADLQLFSYDLTTRKILGEYEDKNLNTIKSIVKRALPGLTGTPVSHDRAKQSYIFRMVSDSQPAEYYHLDLYQQSLVYLASEYPELNDVDFPSMDRVSYIARDGMTIPGFLTRPLDIDSKNLPLIVMPHGGPWSHDKHEFDTYVQFFANRGYAVFQPQFRGSTGYGVEHMEAGYGQWGDAIQDDITDGVRWLIEEGIADKGRVCIVGASFGGYAAAMGAAKTADLYQCAVSINGVLNLKKFIDDGRLLLFKSINHAVWNERKTAEEFSPYHLSEKIKVPLLLLAAERDTVVPVSHSRNMYKKMKRNKQPVHYVELADGEHWRTNEANELIVFKELERFIGRHIGQKPGQ
jgi:dienelactone hydrolase